MAPDQMAARIELTNLRRVQKSPVADEIGRHEAVASPAERFEPVRCDRVIGHSAIVERDEEWKRATRPGEIGGEDGCVRADAGERGELRVEVTDGQLVAVGGVRRESALVVVANVDGMRQK